MAVTAKAVAVKICKPEAKAVYVKLQALTGVPWWVIGVIHYRECGLKWSGSLAQGDPWNKRSVHKPAGRGPFNSFIEAGVDALVRCAPYASRWKDWTPGGALTLLELYNGTGYEHHGVPSPYVWSGTQHYTHGKYVGDGDYKDAVVDKQLGCAIIISEMQKLDDSVMVFGTGEPDPNEYPDPPLPQPDPRVTAPVTKDDPPPATEPDEPSVVDQAKDKAKEVATNAVQDPSTIDKVKSLVKSKIAWLQGTAAAGAAGAATSDDGVWAELIHLMHRPAFWFIVVVVLAIALTIFFRWYDHGRGKS